MICVVITTKTKVYTIQFYEKVNNLLKLNTLIYNLKTLERLFDAQRITKKKMPLPPFHLELNLSHKYSQLRISWLCLVVPLKLAVERMLTLGVHRGFIPLIPSDLLSPPRPTIPTFLLMAKSALAGHWKSDARVCACK